MPAQRRPPTIADVAESAGVSPSTVSRVLSGATEVNPDMTARVRKAAADLGYTPDPIARSLRTQRTNTIAVVITDIQNSFYTAVVRGIEDIARQRGFSVMLCNTDESLEKEAEYLAVVAAARVAGVILAPASWDESDVAHLVGRGTPVVAIDRRMSHQDVDTVLVDNKDGAARATNHLVGLGRKRIGCITGSLHTTTGRERLEGYRSALAAAGMLDEDLIRESDFREEGGFDAAMDLIGTDDPPDALFVANNLMTLGALEALKAAGLRVPGDVALVGFDDEPWAEFTQPSLTVVAQPTYDLGRQAAELLFSRMHGDAGTAREVILKTELKVRESG